MAQSILERGVIPQTQEETWGEGEGGEEVGERMGGVGGGDGDAKLEVPHQTQPSSLANKYIPLVSWFRVTMKEMEQEALMIVGLGWVQELCQWALDRLHVNCAASKMQQEVITMVGSTLLV